MAVQLSAIVEAQYGSRIKKNELSNHHQIKKKRGGPSANDLCVAESFITSQRMHAHFKQLGEEITCSYGTAVLHCKPSVLKARDNMWLLRSAHGKRRLQNDFRVRSE
jgi:hypothetical protein